MGHIRSITRPQNGSLLLYRNHAGLSARYVTDLQLNPQNPATLYVATFAGVFRSHDAGATWTNVGLKGTYPLSLAVNPKAPSTLYAATIAGLYRSHNEGDNWTTITHSLCGIAPPASCPQVREVVLDPIQPTTIYFLTLGGSRIFRTDDGGANWSSLFFGIGGANPSALTIDPLTPSTLYVGNSVTPGNEGPGVFKSTDRGEIWRQINNGLPLARVTTLAVNPASSSTLYAGIADAGLFTSLNGGENWQSIGTGLHTRSIYQILIHPLTPSTLYAATSEGVFESLDGGQSWTPLNEGLFNLLPMHLAFDSQNLQLYVGTGGLGTYRLQENFEIYFAQFGNGEGLTSEVVLINPSRSTTANGNIEFFDDEGGPFLLEEEAKVTSGFSSQVFAGTGNVFEFSIAPLGRVSIATDGRGDLAAGSAAVTSETPVSGVVRFSLRGVGIAGVGPSRAVTGFVVPVRRQSGGINTGIAVHNVGEQSVGLELTLRDSQGQVVAEANLVDFPASGHLARFIGGTGDAFFAQVDTNDFQGTVVVKVRGGKVAATSLELGPRPGEFTTLPVTPLR